MFSILFWCLFQRKNKSSHSYAKEHWNQAGLSRYVRVRSNRCSAGFLSSLDSTMIFCLTNATETRGLPPASSNELCRHMYRLVLWRRGNRSFLLCSFTRLHICFSSYLKRHFSAGSWLSVLLWQKWSVFVAIEDFGCPIYVMPSIFLTSYFLADYRNPHFLNYKYSKCLPLSTTQAIVDVLVPQIGGEFIEFGHFRTLSCGLPKWGPKLNADVVFTIGLKMHIAMSITVYFGRNL